MELCFYSSKVHANEISSAYLKLSSHKRNAVSYGLVGLVFLVDWLTGKEISFSIFYLLPVALAAATIGWSHAMVISILSGVAWYTADYLGGAEYSAAWIPIWNTIMRVLIFMLVARLLISLIATRNKANKAEAAAKRAAQAKSDFLSNMSHEIRTPLNAMLGVAQLLQDSELNDRQTGYVRIFRNEGEQLRRIINDVLDLSKAEAGKFQLELKPFHLGQTARALVQTFNPSAAAKGLKLEADITPQADGSFLGDEQRLRQILSNLIGNAIKFTEQGRILLRITTGGTRQDLLVFQFCVEDTGIGIDPAVQTQLFQRYEQLENRAANLSAGTGLGLSIARTLVESMGGQLHLTSTPNQGSVFAFELALAPAAGLAKDVPALNSGASSLQGLRGKTVLVVEDYQTNQMIFAEYLHEAGCQVALAANGREGVQKYLAGQFDAIIMDMQMPVLDGWSATREIRLWESTHSQPPTPILALTASALKEDELRCQEAGCTKFLAKPALKNELLKALALMLGTENTSPTAAAVNTSITKLLPLFRNEVKKSALELRQAIVAGDWGQVGRVGHQLTGSGATFGYPAITELGRNFEAAAKSLNHAEAQAQLTSLDKLITTFPA